MEHFRAIGAAILYRRKNPRNFSGGRNLVHSRVSYNLNRTIFFRVVGEVGFEPTQAAADGFTDRSF